MFILTSFNGSRHHWSEYLEASFLKQVSSHCWFCQRVYVCLSSTGAEKGGDFHLITTFDYPLSRLLTPAQSLKGNRTVTTGNLQMKIPRPRWSPVVIPWKTEWNHVRTNRAVSKILSRVDFNHNSKAHVSSDLYFLGKVCKIKLTGNISYFNCSVGKSDQDLRQL